MLTTIKYLSELAAIHAVGMRSINRHVYVIQGDRAREVVEWVEGQSLFMTMNAHWDQGRLLGVYVMFDRSAESEQRIREISDAHTIFHLAFRGADGFDWQGPAEPIQAGKSFMRRALAS